VRRVILVRPPSSTLDAAFFASLMREAMAALILAALVWLASGFVLPLHAGEGLLLQTKRRRGSGDDGGVLLFPGENNREFLKFPATSMLSVQLRRPFALQFQGSTDDSLFGTEQGICFARNREFTIGTGNSSGSLSTYSD